MNAPVISLLVAAVLIWACAQVPKSSPTLSYRCQSGATIHAAYSPPDSAVVEYRGESHRMGIAISASGARFVDDRLEWWTKGSGAGSTGTLFRHLADGTSGETIESCVQR